MSGTRGKSRERMGRIAATVAVSLAAAVPTGSAEAAASPDAVCIGELISAIASSSNGPAIGLFASTNAKEWTGIGRVVGEEASTDTCA